MSEIEILHQRFCDYSLALKGNTQRTVRWFKEVFRYFINFSHIECPQQITQQTIESWIFEGKIQKNWEAKTIKNRLQALKSFGDWLVKNNYLTENPLRKISSPSIPKKIPQHLTQEQATEVLDWVKNFPFDYKFERTRAIAIIATFIYTGIRLQELKNLKLQDVDLKARMLFVNAGKGKKDRFVPLHPRLIEILEQYLADRQRLKKTCPYFFAAMRADARMGEAVIKRLVERVRKKSGIHFYPHLLRHTFAVLMLESGSNLFTLSQMMGHSDIKTTTIYLSATKSHLQEQIGKFPSIC